MVAREHQRTTELKTAGDATSTCVAEDVVEHSITYHRILCCNVVDIPSLPSWIRYGFYIYYCENTVWPISQSKACRVATSTILKEVVATIGHPQSLQKREKYSILLSGTV